MGIPSTGDRLDAQVYALRRIERRYKDQIQLVYPEAFVGRIFHDYARQIYTEQFLKSDCDIMWFLDADVVPPDNILNLITKHGDKWKLAGAPYPVFMVPTGGDTKQIVYTTYVKNPNHGGMATCAVPLEGTDFVDGVATGCIFIHREVIEKLSPPYFEFKYDPKTRELIEGEDLGFCKKTSDLGYKFFVDYSMVCDHYKKVSLRDMSDYMIHQQQQTIIACDKQIRQILAKKQLERMNKPAKTNLILP